ncbi:MAG: hypothetical protein ACRDAJ_00580, partial [Serratia fonticola]
IRHQCEGMKHRNGKLIASTGKWGEKVGPVAPSKTTGWYAQDTCPERTGSTLQKGPSGCKKQVETDVRRKGH